MIGLRLKAQSDKVVCHFSVKLRDKQLFAGGAILAPDNSQI